MYVGTGKRTRHIDGLEQELSLSKRNCAAALIAEALDHAHDSVRKRQEHGPILHVDLALRCLRTQVVVAGRVCDVLSVEIGIESCDDRSGAQSLRETRVVMMEKVT